jgi:hypothetical protein
MIVSDSESPDTGAERPDGAAEDDVDGHLADVPDGCGCAEVWEHLSDRRA